MFIIYVIDLSTKNKMLKTGFHIFTKIKNTDRLKLKKNTCFSYFISENPVVFFSENVQYFMGAFLSQAIIFWTKKSSRFSDK